MYRLILGVLCISCAAITACATQSVQPISASIATAPPPPPPPPPHPGFHAYPNPSLSNVNFERDSAEIGPGHNGTQAVNELIAVMKEYPHDTAVIEGHTCDIGSAAYNLALGQRRADAVKDYMLANGIDASRLSTVSHGLTRPVVPNDTDIHRALNRRVQFHYRHVRVDRGSTP